MNRKMEMELGPVAKDSNTLSLVTTVTEHLTEMDLINAINNTDQQIAGYKANIAQLENQIKEFEKQRAVYEGGLVQLRAALKTANTEGAES